MAEHYGLSAGKNAEQKIGKNFVVDAGDLLVLKTAMRGRSP